MDFLGFFQGVALGVGLIAASLLMAFLISLNPPLVMAIFGVLFVLFCGACGAIR